jgi:hypothetical protein
MPNELNCIINAPSTTAYVVLRRIEDGKVYNTINKTFEIWKSPDVFKYAIPLKNFGGDFYATNMPTIIKGNYLKIVYKQTGAIPAITDIVLDVKPFYWKGIGNIITRFIKWLAGCFKNNL